MAHRSGDVAAVRRGRNSRAVRSTPAANEAGASAANIGDAQNLPQCRIKRNYSCSHCSFFSQNPRSFLYHLKDVHFDRINIYECSQCLYASKHSQKLQRHVNMIHVNGKNRVTRRVTRPTRTVKRKVQKPKRSRTAAPRQSARLRRALNENQGNDVSSLPMENDEYEDESEGEEELLRKPLKCSVCNYLTSSRCLMLRHEKVEHPKKRFFRCNKCSYVTHVKTRYTKHVKYHSMPMIKCNLCDFCTPYKWNLDRHYKNHGGSGAFQCAKCNFRADIKQSLTVHEMNHHIPPIGQGAVMVKRRNRVGASETITLESGNIDEEDQGLLRMEREDSTLDENEETEPKQDGGEIQENRVTGKRNLQHLRNLPLPCRRESITHNLQTDFIDPDDIVPRYGQIYVKTLKCKFCNYKAVFEHEIRRHEKRIHHYAQPEPKKQKLAKRPPPKLIPLRSKASAKHQTSPILKIPALRNRVSVLDTTDKTEYPISAGGKSVNEKEFTEMCKKSSLTTSLKDFVSLIGDEEGLKSIPDPESDTDSEYKAWTVSYDDEVQNRQEANKKKQTALLKKKNASFFDKLKEKLLTSTSEHCNLICHRCGYKSKCLSEAVAHQQRHSRGSRSDSEGQTENDIFLTEAELSSTRCQHCRQRCKTSSDLINHLKSCKAFVAAYDLQPKIEIIDIDVKEENMEVVDVKEEEDSNSMENRVFVWNDVPRMYDNIEEEEEEEEEVGEEMEVDETEMISLGEPWNEGGVDKDNTYTQERVTSENADNTESGAPAAEIEPPLNLSTVKKVFKCPHCSFWASTASRFHVHIVGHLNKKPFECSKCLYRSNWRWDITKHIRLKSTRDPIHSDAKVNMTDETGRRNYSKYNKYLIMMRVQEPPSESSGTGRRSKGPDITQGIANESDIIKLPGIPLLPALPALPRLTRAPSPGASNNVPDNGMFNPPPPPLIKATREVTPPPTSRKTLWKCKKCSFRDPNKDVVLSHVKEHYGKNTSDSAATMQFYMPEDGGNSRRNVALYHKDPPYRCGHCHQTSNWKHVIQRHCKLKHNGYVLIELDWKDDSRTEQPLEFDVDDDSTEMCLDTFSCDICPFTTDSEGDLTAHKLNHVDRPGSIFKCTQCPFYVPSKIAVIEHMEVHKIESGIPIPEITPDNSDSSESDEDLTENKTNEAGQKRYKCHECPYESNSRTQFLYHKQFHKPRNSPFKCTYCSYNVSKSHLLQQHLKIHENAQGSQETQKSDSPPDPIPAVEIDTSSMAEIPLVWVFKSGNFHKMYKCRWCPHVNARKTNIQEHEKMHRKIEITGVDPSSFKLKCPNCNYVCNNAGVMSSHAKVHQGYFGEIRSLVDPTRTDAEQIQELQNAIRVVEPEVVINIDEGSENENTEDEGQPQEPEECQSMETPSTEMPQEPGRLSFMNQERFTFDPKNKALSFCDRCPARFFIKKELRIHSKFHDVKSHLICPHCSYTAKQKAHLLSHFRVHTEEYQRRTAELVASYPISAENPRRKTVISAESSDVIEGPVYTIHSYAIEMAKVNAKKRAKYPCSRCPAKFFKSVALQYHLSLHGSGHQYKCKYCDYAVRTYGNLMRHQSVHEEDDDKSFMTSKAEESAESDVSDQEYGDQEDGNQEDADQAEEDQENEDQAYGERITSNISTRSESWNRRKLDPQFGTLIQGSPEFIYPTYRKNGKIREKRYKCHKCPSAFEKREQYKIHLSLHGSKQKYNCEKCDYSVKYYANYVQHMRKHQSHDEALEKIKSKLFQDGQNKLNNEGQTKENLAVPREGQNDKQGNELALVEQQTLTLQEKEKSDEMELELKFLRCQRCPYLTNRQDELDSHNRRHYSLSGLKTPWECMYCDYTALQQNLLDEHTRLHFNPPAHLRPEGYLSSEKMEIWVMEEKNSNNEPGEKKLFFKDYGEGSKPRFYPPITPILNNTDEDYPKVFVNPETGDVVKAVASAEDETGNDTVRPYENTPFQPIEAEELPQEDLAGAVEQQTENKPEEEEAARADAAAKKRWRGKNWKCKKCPHAFNKRDQYLRHISLHGSNQKHNCDLCDYSVKFYTNYVQHMKMHQVHEPDRVILVKKNLKTGNTSSTFSQEASIGTEAELFVNPAEEAGFDEGGYYESDSVIGQVEEKLAVEQCGETDQEYMSSTDASSDEEMCQEIENSSLGLGPDVSAFVKYETDAS